MMSYSDYCEGYNKAMAEIGVELDRLRKEKAELQKQNDDLRGDYPRNIGMEITEAFADNQRLRAENSELRDAFADGECFCNDVGCTDPLPDNCPKLLPEVSRLRTEKAELIEMLATRTTHPEYVELLRRYRHASETEGTP